jgi:hypothetical protein
MYKMVFNCKSVMLWFSILLGMIGLLNLSEAHADPRPEAPPTDSPSGDRSGGGTRPELTRSCPETAHPPTAIAPENANGATTSEYPVFWFYIPYSAYTVSGVEFSLLNQDETQTLYRARVQLGNTPGIVSVPIPSTQTRPLEQNATYRWYLTLDCQPKQPLELNDFILTGWIARTTPNPQFRWDGVWYDALNHTAALYRANPQDRIVQSNWTELLKSVELEDLTSVPLVN